MPELVKILGSRVHDRMVVGAPNRGTGRRLLTEVVERAFGEYGAHRLFLDVFVNNDRPRHVYQTSGFSEEGIMRDQRFGND